MEEEIKPKHAGGRPTKLTPETKKKLLDGIKIGMPIDAAVSVAGIDKVTFYSWKNRGEKDTKGIFREFLNSLKEAEAIGIASLLQTIHKSTQGGNVKTFKKTVKDSAGNIISVTEEERMVPIQFTPAAWILERRFPNQFGRNREVKSDLDNKPLPFMGTDEEADIKDPLGEVE